MTSSLVGSEMCIRDSTSPIPRLTMCRRAHGHVGINAALRHQPTHGEKPVSYTHLTLPTICSV
eukprot:4321860-Prorocentrum_lima.AAC.1